MRLASKDWKSRRRAIAASLVVVGFGLLAWGIVPLFDSGAPSPDRPVLLGLASEKTYPCPIPGDFKPVEIPVGLLCDYYEHGIEHAPPRDPSGVMQRRERFYRAPPDPFDVLEARHPTAADAALLQTVRICEGSWRTGAQVTPENLARIQVFASESTLPALSLLDAGRAFVFLAGDELGGRLYRAGLSKAQGESASVAPGDSASVPLLHALDQTKALYRLRDYRALEERFSLAMRLLPPLSPEARRAAYLHADALYYQRRNYEAAEAIVAVMDQHRQAGDLGALEKSDIPEMEWAQGLFLYSAARYPESLPHLKAVVAAGGEHLDQALPLVVVALAKTGSANEADSVMCDYARRYRPAVDDAVPLFAAIDEARLNNVGDAR